MKSRRRWCPPTDLAVAKMKAANREHYESACVVSKVLLSREINSRGQLKTVTTMRVKEQYL